MPKHGDIGVGGMVFWSEDRGREIWMDPAKYFFRKNTVHRNARARYSANIDESRARVREYGRANKEMKAASFRAWADRNKERTRNSRLRRAYGMSPGDYESMLELQGGRCAICGDRGSSTNGSGVVYDLCVDHCHKTGQVRKLLCHSCNTGIGQLRDSPALLMRAAEYINEHLTAPAQMGGVSTQNLRQ